MNDLHCEISFAEKVRIFSLDYLKCCIYISKRQTPNYVFTKKLYSKLIGTSQVLKISLISMEPKTVRTGIFTESYAPPSGT